MGLFGGKEKEGQAPMSAPPTDTPTSLVLQMRQQGNTNTQIQQYLQQQGYNNQQIYNAMSQADIKGIVTQQPMQQQPMQQQPMQQQPMPPEPMPPSPEPSMTPPSNTMNSYQMDRTEKIEEIAEGIIDEKWDELMKSVDKIIAWKEETEARVGKIEQAIKDVKENFDQLHKGVLAKVGDYDKSIKEVGTDIKAMEAVFKKILPSFTENVAELSRITKRVKK